MKRKKTALFLALCLSLGTLTGCSTEETKNYKQAEQDLQDGNYKNALQEYEIAVTAGVKLAQSYRGAGVANLHLGNYAEAIEDFDHALDCEKVGKALEKDILSYRVAAYLELKDYDAALADCQTLEENHKLDADLYFIFGKVTLAMDSYEEASSYFAQAYEDDATYDMAIRIYAAYLAKDMEADGTRYLESALSGEAKNAQDHCDRGRVYYYMDDYENAAGELKQAIEGENTEALVLLGMVYLEQGDTANARTMFQKYVSQAEDNAKGYNGLALCDIEDKDYDAALSDINNGLSAADHQELQSLLFNEIVVYEKKLDFVTACQKAEEYMQMYPEDTSAKKELAFLRTRVTGSVSTTSDAAAEAAASADGAAEDVQAQ